MYMCLSLPRIRCVQCLEGMFLRGPEGSLRVSLEREEGKGSFSFPTVTRLSVMHEISPSSRFLLLKARRSSHSRLVFVLYELGGV